MADSFQYLAKPIQYCKVKKKKRIGDRELAQVILIPKPLLLSAIAFTHTHTLAQKTLAHLVIDDMRILYRYYDNTLAT